MNAITNMQGMTLRGAGGGKGGGGGGVEAPNTLRSDAVIRVIDVLSEGEIGGLVAQTYPGQSIFFNDTPLQDATGKFNFEGVSYQVRYGLPGQTPVPGYPAVETVDSIGSSVAVLTGPVVFSVNNTAVTSLVATVTVASLYDVDTSNGNMNPYYVGLKIEIQPNGQTVWTQVVQDVISGKCVAAYQRSYKFSVPQGTVFPIAIRMTRTSPDDATSSTSSAFTWTTLTEQIEHQLIYPDTAYIALTADATAFGGSIPTRTYEITGLKIKVPANYDPVARTYAATGIGTTAGTWDGVTFQIAVSNNPAWVLYDLLTNTRYGLGDTILPGYCDVFALYTIGQYCDGLVDNGAAGLEPRFTFNGVINTLADAYSTVQSIASAFAGMTYWGAGHISVIQDAPAGITKLFTESNVIDGAFTYEGTALNARHSMCAVQYLDPTNAYRATVELVSDPQMIQLLGVRRKDITGFGITSRGQAIRLARWTLDSEKHSTEVVQFSVGNRDCDVRPGMVVAVQDAQYAGVRNGGLTLVPPASSAIQRTNLLANGNAAGAVGPTNTLPTGWSCNAHGALVQVIGTGISDTGIGFVDLKVTGSALGLVDIAFTPPLSASAATDYTGSVFCKLMAGDYTSVTGMALHVTTGTAVDAAGLDLRTASTSGFIRGQATLINTAAGTAQTHLVISTTLGALSFVLRLGGAQQEIGGNATRYISTSGASSTIYEPNPNTVYLDGPVTLVAGFTYTLLVTDPSGTVQIGTVLDGAGTYTALDMTSPLPASPPPGSVWVLQSASVAPRPFRVLSVAESAKNVYEVIGLQYDSGKYGRVDFNLPFVDTNYSDLLPQPSDVLAPPTGINAVEYVTGVGSTSVDTITLSWSVTNDGRVIGYEYQVLAADGITVLIDQNTTQLTVDITGLVPANYYFQVRGKTATGAFSAWTISGLFTDTGLSSVPNPTSAMTVIPTFNSNLLTWANPADRLLRWVEVWQSTDTVLAHASLIATTAGSSYSSANLNNLVTYSYWTRVVDTTGQVSSFTGPISGRPLQVSGADLANGLLTLAAFAASVQPIFVWTGASLPANPAAVNNATLILNQADWLLYTWNPNLATPAWISTVNSITASNITSGTLNVGVVMGSLANFGSVQITAAQIQDLTITGRVIADHAISNVWSVFGPSINSDGSVTYSVSVIVPINAYVIVLAGATATNLYATAPYEGNSAAGEGRGSEDGTYSWFPSQGDHLSFLIQRSGITLDSMRIEPPQTGVAAPLLSATAVTTDVPGPGTFVYSVTQTFSKYQNVGQGVACSLSLLVINK